MIWMGDDEGRETFWREDGVSSSTNGGCTATRELKKNIYFIVDHRCFQAATEGHAAQKLGGFSVFTF